MDIVTGEDYNKFVARLYELSSGEEFIAFQKKIIATSKTIIGVRTPELRTLAKEIYKSRHSGLYDHFKGESFEETLVYGFVVASEKDRDEAIKRLNKLYSKLDNWAEVDMIVGSLSFAKNKKYKAENYEYFKDLLKQDEEFIVRFGVVALMKYYLDEENIEDVFQALYAVKCDKYYVNMAIAWLIFEVLVKNPQNAIKIMQKIIKNSHFNSFIINKSIQKACESYRIDAQIKSKLKEMKIK